MWKRKTLGEIIYEITIHAVLVFIVFICLLPLVTLLAKSFSREAYVLAGDVTLVPIDFNLDAYRVVFYSNQFWTSFRTSVIVTFFGTIFNALFTIFVAYAVSRRDMPASRFVSFLYIVTMFFGGGLIPTYLVVKSVGLLDTLFALFVPGLVSAFNMIILRNYFIAIPDSLEESAYMDGASNVRILFRIMIPLAMPSIATIALFCAVGYWNSYFDGLLYITTRARRPLQVYLRDIIMESDNEMSNLDLLADVAGESVRGATVIVATVPILLVYPFLQKYFVKGVMLGSIKE